MKMLLQAIFPNEPFNTLVRSGEVGRLMQRIFEDLKPEAVYFTEQDGERTAIMVINPANPAEIPKFAEPFFLKFNARCLFRAVMSRDDLKNAGLEALGKKWA
jgi:hypothetical protein